MRLIIILLAIVNFVACTSGNRREHTAWKDRFANAHVVAEIDYKMSGCFGGETCNLTIFNAEGKTQAILTSLTNGTLGTTLDDNKLQAYTRFIGELRTLEFGFGCTTKEVYSVKIGNEKIEKRDGGCSWNGFSTLRHVLFDE